MFEIAFAVLLVLAVGGSLAVAGSRVAALVWPVVNRPVLMVIGQGHGLTVSDLLAPVGVVVSVLVLSGWLRRPPRGSNAGRGVL